MITLCCLSLPGIVYFSGSFDIYLWWLSHHFAMWWYLYHYTMTERLQYWNIFMVMMLSVMNSKCLVMEWKMIWQGMWRNYQKGFYQKKRLGRSLPLKATKVTLFTMILYNSENSIHSLRPFCLHCLVTAMLWCILHLPYSSDTAMRLDQPNITETSPPNHAGFICPAVSFTGKNSFICDTHWLGLLVT